MQNLFQYVSQLSTDAQVGIAVAILVPIIGAVWKWWKRPSPFAIAIEGMKPTNTGDHPERTSGAGERRRNSILLASRRDAFHSA